MSATQCGVYHESYASDMQLRPTTVQRWRLMLVLLLAIAFPFVASNDYQIQIACQVLIAAVGAMGLNILVGYTGQISLGQGAFLAVGAYASGLLQVMYGVPWFIAMILAAFITAAVGALFGIPSLRLKGLYLAVATLAAQQIVQWVIINWDQIDGKIDGKKEALIVPTAQLFGTNLSRTNPQVFYFFGLLIVILCALGITNLFRTHIGRAFIAIRDQDIAAEVMGVNPFQYKLLSFATSSFFVGLAGAMMAQFNNSISFERFTITVSIAYLAMIIIGGLGTVAGSIYGAAFITLLPEALRELASFFASLNLVSPATTADYMPFLQEGSFGLVIVLTLMFEPDGIVKLWRDIKDYFRLFPFSY